MRAGRFSFFTPLALTAVFALIVMSAWEWLDHLVWPGMSPWQHQVHSLLFVSIASCIAGFFILRNLRTRSIMASIVESTEDGIIAKDLDGRITSWNMGAQQIYGYSFDEVKGKPTSILVARDVVDETPKILDKIREGKRVEHIEALHVRKDGKPIHVSLTVSPIKKETGTITGASTIVRDITGRKRMEEELQRAKASLEDEVKRQTADLVLANERLTREIEERKHSEETLRQSEIKYKKLSQEFDALLNAISDTLVLLSPEMKVLWTNNGTAYHVDAPLAELTGQCCYDLFYGRTQPCEDCPVVRCFQTGEAEAQVSSRSGRFLDKRAYPIKDGDQVSSVILLVSDITEKMSMQAEAMQANHLASLGELAAGVAHEINNPINGIINYAQILINECGPDSLENDIGRRIVKEGDRIADIVRSLLSFARGGREDKRPARVDAILKESLILTQAQIRKESIRLETYLAEDLPEIEANFQQIQQVFLNLISNARYAIHEKYPARHEDKVIEVRGARVTVNGWDHVRITFHDRGVGIPADKMPLLTKPFFSTKPFGKGTGLGLAITHKIVTDHGGQLSFESVEGEFTRVTVDLPAKGFSSG